MIRDKTKNVFVVFYQFYSKIVSCEFNKFRVDTHFFKLRDAPTARFYRLIGHYVTFSGILSSFVYSQNLDISIYGIVSKPIKCHDS